MHKLHKGKISKAVIEAPATISVIDVTLDNHKCGECGYVCKNKRSVGIHVNNKHSMTLQQYVLKQFYGGAVPYCSCGCHQNVVWHKTQNCFNEFVNGHNAFNRRIRKV
jgi:hypothetical protein